MGWHHTGIHYLGRLAELRHRGGRKLIRGWVPLSAQYTENASTSSIFGTDQEDHSGSKNLNLFSNYKLRGSPRSALSLYLTHGGIALRHNWQLFDHWGHE